ncbi:MAG: carboxypeptidase regulatory-like domain-containing protein [Blastocatellales bacterium]
MQRTLRRILLALAIIISGGFNIQAQTEAPPLPLKRVTLYKHGVGYFERQGKVNGDRQLTFLFDAAQMNDVLKSLVVLDLGKGNISSVTFDSTKPFDKQIEEFGLRLDSSDKVGLTSLLGQLKGARVEVRSNVGGALSLTGSVVGIEKRTGIQANGRTEISELVLINDSGELRSIQLDQIRGIKILDAKVREDIDRYLSILRSSIHKNLRPLTISTNGNGERDMFVSYVVEAPVWKATYRIVIDQKAKPFLQGWALVDNVQDEDWTNVTLSLIAGAPVSFIQDLQQPRYKSRPVVGMPEDISIMPTVPQAEMGMGFGGGVGSGRGGNASIEGTVTDASGAAIPNVTVVAINNATGQQSSAVTDSDGDYSLEELSPGSYRITAVATGFKTATLSGLRIDSGMTANGDFTLEVGGISETVEIVASEAPAKSPVKSRRVMSLAALTPGAAIRGDSSGVIAATETQEIGELFEYRISHPVTIKRNSSALIPILQKTIEGETVSLYNRSTRESNPMSAVYLTNNTGLTLESGPVTIIENDTYAGEALTGRVKPGEKRFITYAVDLGCRVSVKSPVPDEKTFMTQFINGELRVHYRQTRKTVYTLDNVTERTKTVIIEHPWDKNSKWELTGDDKPFETTEDYRRFKVTIAPNTSTELVVMEELPETATFAISNVSSNDIALYVKADYLSPEMKKALDEIVELKARISAFNRQIAAKGAEINTITKDQERMRENLKALGKTEEEKRLVQRYVNRIAEDEDRIEGLQAEVRKLNDERAVLQRQVDDRIRGLALEKRMN